MEKNNLNEEEISNANIREDEQSDINVNEVDKGIQIQDSNKDDYNWRMMLTILIVSILFLSVILFIKYNDAKNVGNKEKVNNNDVDTNNSNESKVLTILKYTNSNSIYVIDTAYYDTVKYEKIGEYTCKSRLCNAFYKNSTNYDNASLVIYDGSYYLYNYETKEEEELFLGTIIYDEIIKVSYENKLYGLIVKNKDKMVAYYSIEDEKYITDFEYDSIYPNDYSYSDNTVVITKGYIFTRKCNSSDNCDNSIIDINTNTIKLQLNNKYGAFSVAENAGNFYFLSTIDDWQYTWKFYNSSFESLFDGNEYSYKDYVLIKGGGFIIKNNSNTFSIYNSEGKKTFTSKEYSSVEFVVNDYAVVIDDGYLKLIDSNDNEVTTFVKWTDEMYLHTIISGYYTYEGKPHGVYVTVEDKSIPEGTLGRAREYYYDVKTKETGIYEEREHIGGYAKPVLYLYPEKKTDIKVTFEKPNLLTTTYPKFNKYWEVSAYSNGDLYDKSGKYYYGLYWEEDGYTEVDFSTGFYVTTDNAIAFLEDKLSKIGLNDRERNEFIMYWLPILEKNEKNLVYFELTEEREAYNKLIINPIPDSLLRLAIHIKKVDKKINIKEQKIPVFNRKGFVAVEWGGVLH